jgi:hypothetical protein
VKKFPFVSKVGRYYVTAPEGREVIKATLLYHDRKTQVPKRVVELLKLTPGQSLMLWVLEGGRIIIESAKGSV